MTMEQTINRELLKHHVSTQIFCAKCQKVMDVRQAVSVELVQGSKLRTFAACVECFDASKGRLFSDAYDRKVTVTVLDGREYYPSRKRKAKV